MPHFFQKPQQTENRRLSPLLLSVLAVVSLVATVHSTSLAVAAECQATEDDGTIKSMAAGQGSASSILPLTITLERDTLGGLVLFTVREGAPGIKNSRIFLDNTKNQGSVISGACLSQDILKSELFNHAMFTSIGKFQANVRTQSMKVSALPYNGKRQVRTIRTAPLEIGVSDRSKAATVIGSAQDIQLPSLPDRRSVSRVVVGLLSTVESSSQFGGRPFIELNPFASASQLPDNESLRMNRTSAQALHGGNCASECP